MVPQTRTVDTVVIEALDDFIDGLDEKPTIGEVVGAIEWVKFNYMLRHAMSTGARRMLEESE